MRKIDKSPHIPVTLQNAPVPTCPNDVKPSVYKANDVRSLLCKDQYYKCAYCECDLRKAFNDVEHYRPKSKYYWLGYDWNNLLYSCNECNRTLKNDAFPLVNEANRVTSPGDMSGEEPLIINPAIDEPTDHIRFNRHMMTGITAKGQKTIEVFKLNERKELIHRREQTFEKYKIDKEALDNIQEMLESPSLSDHIRDKLNKSKDLMLRAIQEHKSPDNPYSGILVNQ